jgi:hypothetical protein
MIEMPEPCKHRITNATTGETVEMDMSWDDIRGIRDGWLRDSDMWMLVDKHATLTPSQQTELATFREALRNLPTSVANPADAEFPDKPSFIG